ncbi:hypothetical protein [Chitinivorax sp. B]|uniref:hypothetical protein n=1 Tax=Chitinivorax sp. B TaxID=2502235 RepID=UPI0010F8C3CF|nr:hypothetical protein [Chitinivorax sp. B]
MSRNAKYRLVLLVSVLLPWLSFFVLSELLQALAHFIPHTFTERTLHNLFRCVIVLSALTAIWSACQLDKPWRKKGWSVGLVLVFVTLPYLAAVAVLPLHHHCWEPNHYLEQPSTMDDVPCE